ncbi:nuclear receptor-interacting protein 2 [Trichomycterus rosablanca]|uniref:nuclear receptor-interacting protein 2 n=1 Tax=Trichomycterus rosablanca TaxID=2290929 RepID=UPI002F3514FF
MSESKKSEVELRDKAIMHQQRRLKQATQFSHKDSADLLPLDGLKRLGTSKDLQPHSIVQRRLLEGNVPRLGREAVPSLVCSPLAKSKGGTEAEERSESTLDDSTEEKESPESEKSLRSDEEEDDEDQNDGESSDAVGNAAFKHKWTDIGSKRGQAESVEEKRAPILSALQVLCKCGDAEVKVSINTGCRYNHISSTCCRRLGLKVSPENKSDSTANAVTSMQLQLGEEKVQCTAQIIDDDAFELCLGLHTLVELRCCVDLNTRVLHLPSNGEKLPFLDTPARSQCHQRNNKHL